MARLILSNFYRQSKMNNLTNRQIRRIRKRILSWGRMNYRIYPWRSDTDAWLTFVAEFFLQRTRAEQVETVYQTFCRLFPTPFTVVSADFQQLYQVMQGLGLTFRTKYLREIAQTVVRRGGTLPETMEELTNLRGVGTYTAAAWLSLHRKKRAVLVDSNVCRWLSRMTGNAYCRDPRHISWIKELANQLTPARAYRDYNYAVLDFTMHICTPRNPKCGLCPIRSDCFYGASSLRF